MFIQNKENSNSYFKSLRKCKRHNKENFALKSNSNEMMLCGGGDNIILFQSNNFIFQVYLQFLGELNNDFNIKDLKD